MQRVVIIDASVIAHKCIFSWGSRIKSRIGNEYIPNPDYTYFKMILSLLKRISVTESDIVMMALDARNSWRKAFYPIYKGNRKENRDKHEEIDWSYHYGKIEDINNKLNESTNWHFIQVSNFMAFEELEDTEEGKNLNITSNNIDNDELYGIEADDIMAVACTYFKDKEVIIASVDVDLDQLTYYQNTNIFSLNYKYKGGTGVYKLVKDPLKIIADKVRKGDASDNIIVNKKEDTPLETQRRKFIIDLINMPKYVTEPIIKEFDKMQCKLTNYDNLPYPKSLGSKEEFNKIYSTDKRITLENSIKFFENKEKKKKKKSQEAYQRRKTKLAKEKIRSLR
jgi:hypothetical protein